MLKIDPELLGNTDMLEVLQYLIEKHDPSKAVELQEYYIGEHNILTRKMADMTKPNNKLVNNLASYITDTLTGYFMGKPVSYSVDEVEGGDAYLEALTEINEYNDEQDHNAELAKGQSIKGAAYELLFIDEESKIRIAQLPREGVIFVESDDLKGEPALAVRIYDLEDVKGNVRHYYDVYTDIEILTYELRVEENTKSLIFLSRAPHFFGSVPVIQYPNNSELMGDFEGVLTLIDAYNKAQSDTANDFEYFTDAYLVMTGVRLGGDEKDPKGDLAIAAMRERRLINLPDKECAADFLIKDINDTAVENFKNRIRRDIHALSKTPNLTDEQFAGQLSGVAIAYKLWGMEQIAAIKERKFKKGLQRRVELITNILNLKGKSYDWRDINIVFSRNMPQNLMEITDMVSRLKGIVSEETLLSQIPFVEDVQEEIIRLEAERETTIDLDIEEEGDEPEEVSTGGQNPGEVAAEPGS